MNERQQVGRTGEDIAVGVLEQHGHVILARNWRHGHKEVDIVSLDGKEIVFTEVKCRTGDPLEEPYKAVNQEKQRFLVRAANAYVHMYQVQEEVRFDVVSVILGPPLEVEYFKRAFFPPVSSGHH